MVEYLVTADTEPAVVAEIEARWAALDATPVPMGTRIPTPRPAEFGRVLATGGGERDMVTDEATVVLEGWATSETRAQRICAFMVAAVQAAGRAGKIGDVPCYRVRVASLPANLPMPSIADRFRFTATVSVDLRKVTV